MAIHLVHGKNAAVANPAGNTRNGKSKKTLKGDFGGKILPPYVPGMTVRTKTNTHPV